MEELREVILDTAERIEDLGCRITPWYEFTPGPGLTGELEQMILCLGAANKAGLELGWVYAQAGAWKLRCGGTDPATIPSPSLIAHLLSTCGRAQVGFKATAGLHHPIRHFDPRSQDYLHGFINLFVAAVFAHLSVSQEKTTLLLEDTDPAHFYFDDEGLRWGDTFATTAQVRHLRTEMVTSFGSCSFEEPVAELKALGWLS